MRKQRTVEPAEPAVSLEEVRQWLSLNTALVQDDPTIEGLITKAVSYWESETNGHVLVTQQWKLHYDAAELVEHLYPRLVPIGSVTEIKGIDDGGTETVLDPGTYQLRPGLYPRISTLTSWPSVRALEGLEITVSAGYGAAAAVPEDLRQTVVQLVGFYYSSKGVGVLETISGQVIGVPNIIRERIRRARLVPA